MVCNYKTILEQYNCIWVSGNYLRRRNETKWCFSLNKELFKGMSFPRIYFVMIEIMKTINLESEVISPTKYDSIWPWRPHKVIQTIARATGLLEGVGSLISWSCSEKPARPQLYLLHSTFNSPVSQSVN